MEPFGSGGQRLGSVRRDEYVLFQVDGGARDAHLGLDGEHHAHFHGPDLGFADGRGLGPGHADAVSDALGALHLGVAVLLQLGVGHPRDLADGGSRLHHLDTLPDQVQRQSVLLGLVGARGAEDRLAGDVAVVALVARAEVGDQAVAFFVAPLVVLGGGVQHEKAGMARVGAFLDHGDVEAFGHFPPGDPGLQVRQDAVEGTHGDVAGPPHVVHLPRALEQPLLGERPGSVLDLGFGQRLGELGEIVDREAQPLVVVQLEPHLGGTVAHVGQELAQHLPRKGHVDVAAHLAEPRQGLGLGLVVAVHQCERLALPWDEADLGPHQVVELVADEAGEVPEVVTGRGHDEVEPVPLHEPLNLLVT